MMLCGHVSTDGRLSIVVGGGRPQANDRELDTESNGYRKPSSQEKQRVVGHTSSSASEATGFVGRRGQIYAGSMARSIK